MIDETFYNGNLFLLADTLGLDLECTPSTGKITGQSTVPITISKDLTLDTEFAILNGYRFLNDNVGVRVVMLGWEYNLFAYTHNRSVIAVLIDAGVKLPDYNTRAFVDLSKLDGIIGACQRKNNSDSWITIKLPIG
jgi:hypothetical protein